MKIKQTLKKKSLFSTIKNIVWKKTVFFFFQTLVLSLQLIVTNTDIAASTFLLSKSIDA